MARAGWNNISARTRARYERAGITRSDYDRGASLQVARGHGTTPEHKGRKLTPAQQSRKASKPARRGKERPFGPITKERHKMDVRNARERARRYAARPQSEREAEWSRHSSEEALFWEYYKGAVNR
jgi:hypothetical protein